MAPRQCGREGEWVAGLEKWAGLAGLDSNFFALARKTSETLSSRAASSLFLRVL